MQQHKLRLFNGSDDKPSSTSSEKQSSVPSPRRTPETVTVSAVEVLPVLADAFSAGRAWLKDFENDEITIPFDLYEVILAYQHYQRLSA